MRQKAQQFVEHLRSKSEETRKHILTVTMLVVAAILVIIWGASLGARKPATAAPIVTEDAVRPFQLMKANFAASFHTVSAGIRGLKDDFKSGIRAQVEPEPSETYVPISATGETAQ